jgi:hypothetical protein
MPVQVIQHGFIAVIQISRDEGWRIWLQVYEEAAAEDGVSLKDGTHGVRDFSMRTLPGTYRRVLYKPKDLTWRLLAYTNPDADLLASDLTVALQRSPPTATEIKPGMQLFFSPQKNNSCYYCCCYRYSLVAGPSCL